jgi:hypothetical protein
MSGEYTNRGALRADFPCSLGEACRSGGYDQEGRRCADCLVRYRCENDDHWIVHPTLCSHRY